MIDVGAAFQVLLDVASEKDPVRVVQDARTVYEYYTAPNTVTAAIRAGKLTSVTGPLARTLTLADKLASDPSRAPHVAALLQSLMPDSK